MSFSKVFLVSAVIFLVVSLSHGSLHDQEFSVMAARDTNAPPLNDNDLYAREAFSEHEQARKSSTEAETDTAGKLLNLLDFLGFSLFLLPLLVSLCHFSLPSWPSFASETNEPH